MVDQRAERARQRLRQAHARRTDGQRAPAAGARAMAAPQQPQPAPAVSKPSRQEAPWLPLLPKEAGGTLHGLGRYLFAQAIVVQRETISVDVYDQMFTLPRLPGNFKPCNDHRPTPAQVLALTCRVAAYTPLSIIVDIKAVLQAVNKTVRDALLLGYVPLPSHVEAHLARVCAAGCGAQCVATEGPGGGVTGMRNNRIWYCNLACRNEHTTRVPEGLRAYAAWTQQQADELYWKSEIATGMQPAASGEPPVVKAPRCDNDTNTDTDTSLSAVNGPQQQDQQKKRRQKRKKGKQDKQQVQQEQLQVQEQPPGSPAPTPAADHATIEPVAPPQYELSVLSVVWDLVKSKHVWRHTYLTQHTLVKEARLTTQSEGKNPMWHVRRHVLERMAARMGLPAVSVQALLWAASQRGDACGALTAVAQADPAGLSLPPELREPYRVWAALSELTSRFVFFTLSEAAVHAILAAFLRNGHGAAEAVMAIESILTVCATCGQSTTDTAPVAPCKGCNTLAFCSSACRKPHKSSGACQLLVKDKARTAEGRGLVPAHVINANTRQQAASNKAPAATQRAGLTRLADPVRALWCQAGSAVRSAGVSAFRGVSVCVKPTTQLDTHEPHSEDASADCSVCVADLDGKGVHVTRMPSCLKPPSGENKDALRAMEDMWTVACGLLDEDELQELRASLTA